MIQPGPVVHRYEHGAVVESRTGTHPLITVRYSQILNNPTALHDYDLELPWNQIREIRPSHDNLLIAVHDSKRPVARIDAKLTPH